MLATEGMRNAARLLPAAATREACRRLVAQPARGSTACPGPGQGCNLTRGVISFHSFVFLSPILEVGTRLVGGEQELGRSAAQSCRGFPARYPACLAPPQLPRWGLATPESLREAALALLEFLQNRGATRRLAVGNRLMAARAPLPVLHGVSFVTEHALRLSHLQPMQPLGGF